VSACADVPVGAGWPLAAGRSALRPYCMLGQAL